MGTLSGHKLIVQGLKTNYVGVVKLGGHFASVELVKPGVLVGKRPS